ncbi:MAG: hypothetical protein AAGD96_14045 [Chloroflexota bacterium]
MFGIRFKSLLSLKAYVIVAFIAFWNAGFLLGRYLGGGGIQASFEPVAMKTTGITCALAGLFFLSVAASTKVQSILVAPSRSNNFRSREFYILAFLTCGMAIGYLFIGA